MLDYITQMSDRQFKSSTGHSKEEFNSLLKDYKAEFESEYGCSYATYINERIHEDIVVKLPNLDSCLFFVLYQYKNGLIYDSLGFTFQMGGSTAYENFKRYSSLLESTLKKRQNLS